VRLDVEAVCLSARKGELRILGKGWEGGKPRTVPVHPELRPVLQAWLDERSSWPGADTPALLLIGPHARRGRPG
jgi:integrase